MKYIVSDLHIHIKEIGSTPVSEKAKIIQRNLGSYEGILLQLCEEITGKTYEEIAYGIVEEFPRRIAKHLKIDDDFVGDDVFNLLNSYVHWMCKDKYPDVAQTAIRVDVEGY